MTILFIQGAGEDAHDAWDQKLVASLQREVGEAVRFPRMPREDEPAYPAWRAAILQELASLEPGAIAVGHSVGGTLLLHTLADAQPDVKLAAIITLAAPFIGEGGWPSEDVKARYDFGERLPAVPIYLFHGTADTTAPLVHVELYAKTMPRAVVRTLADRDHQLNDDLSEVARVIETCRSSDRLLR